MAWLEPKRKEDGPPYYVRWQDGKAKPREGPFHDWDEAKTARNKRDSEQRNRKRAGRTVADGGLSIKDLFEKHLAEQIVDLNLAPTTQHLKRRYIESFLERCPLLADLNTEVIDAWKTDLMTRKKTNDEGYSPSTISMMMRVLRTFTKWLWKKKYIAEDPMLGYSIPMWRERKDLVHSKEDMEKLLDSAPDPLFRLFLTFAFFQGLRKMMIRKADFSHFDKAGMWTIPAEHTKARREECVPLHPRALAELKKVYPVRPSAGPVFPGYSDSLIWVKWKIAQKKAALPYHLTIHGMRRSWATKFMAMTQNLDALMRAGAWKDVKTAMKYQHIAQAWLKKEVNRFEYD